MKEFLKKYSKYLVVLLIAIISFVASINLSISKYSQSTDKYEIFLDKDSKIDYIVLNDNVQGLYIYEDDNFKYDYDNSDLIALNDTKLTVEYSVIDKVDIRVLTNNKNFIKKNGVIQDTNNNEYFYDISKIDVLKSSINLYTLLYFIVFYFVFLICFLGIKNTIDKINNDKVKLKDIILFFISNFILFVLTIYTLLYIFKTLILFIIIGYITFLLYLIRKKITLENTYIILGTIIGLSFLFLIPPFSVPDEPNHYTKSLAMLDNKYKNDNGYAKIDIDTGHFMTYYSFTSMDREVKFNGKNYIEQYLNKKSNIGTDIKPYQNTKNASPLPYFLSSIIVKISKLFNLSPLLTFINARMINLLLSFILCYLALHLIPKFKKILFVIMLLPSFVQAQIGINMDSFTNALSIIIIAYLIKLIYQKNKINYKQILVLIVMGLFLSFCKFGSFPIMFLAILIPYKKIDIKRINPIIVKIFIMFFVMIISYLYSAAGAVSDAAASNEFYTMSYIIANPISTLNLIISTIIERSQIDLFYGHYNVLGTYTKYVPGFLSTYESLILIILLLMNDDQTKKISIYERFIYLSIALILIMIPCYAMLLCWTNIDASIISGLHPRYFITALVFLYIALSNNILNINIKNKNLVYVIGVLFIFMVSLYTLADGFY